MLNRYNVLTYTLLIILTCLIGAASYYVASGVMNMLEFGGIFWKLRLNKFLKYADGFQITIISDILKQDLNDKDMDNLKLNETYPFEEKRDSLNKLFWQIVTDKPELKLWLCAECLAYRIAIFYTICVLTLCFWFGYISWWGGLIFWFFSLPLLTSAITIQAKINE